MGNQNSNDTNNCLYIHSISQNYSNISGSTVEEKQCNFASKHDACEQGETFYNLNYIALAYCGGSLEGSIAGVAIFLLFLFPALGTITDEFFCPSLVVISDILHINENVAGVTLLALGNGAADVFAAILSVINMEAEGAGLAFGALFGAALFCSSVIFGIIAIYKPQATVAIRPFIRDAGFCMTGTICLLLILLAQRIDTAQTGLFIAIYVFYVFFVVISNWANRRIRRKKVERKTMERAGSTVSIVSYSLGAEEEFIEDAVRKRANKAKAHHDHRYSETYYAAEMLHMLQELRRRHRTESLTQGIQTKGLSKGQIFKLMVKDALIALSPFTIEEFMERPWYKKMLMLWNAPFTFMFNLTTPRVGERGEWIKMLNALQLVIGPVFLLFAFGEVTTTIPEAGDFPIVVIVVAIGLVGSILVFITAPLARPPKYYKPLFATIAFLTSIIWIYTLANQIVNMLSMIGVVTRISSVFLGGTILAWANSVADTFANLVLTKQGYHQMAVSACFGAPVFNQFLGIGIPFLYKGLTEGVDHLDILASNSQFVVVGSFGLSIIVNYIWLVVCRGKLNRIFGTIQIIIYAAYFLLMILFEANVIQL